jgi:hypothetical protein
MKADFTTTADGNGILLRAYSKEARKWLRDQDAERDLDGLDLDVWDHSTWLPHRKGYSYFILGELLDCQFSVEGAESAAA